MITTEIKIKCLKPQEGYVLFDGNVYSDCVYLGANDSEENWTEVTIEQMEQDKFEQAE